MPMGFYQPAQIIYDAQKHGVEVLPIDINYSRWDNILEERTGKYCPIRLGFRQVTGLREEDMQILIAAREQPFTSIQSIRDAGVSQTALEKLADADAFRSLGIDRRSALWEVSALNDRPTGMYEGQPMENAMEKDISLPGMSLPEHVLQDYSATSLSLRAHPVSFARDKLTMLDVRSSKDLDNYKDGDPIKVSGLVLVRQRPGTASGIVFITLEDETGVVNLVVFKHIFEKYRKEIVRAKLLMAEGKLQREGEVTHVIVSRCYDLSALLTVSKTEDSDAFMTLSKADEDGTEYDTKDQRLKKQKAAQLDIFHGGRNFR
ncbi:MAG: error-prone polymerase [Flavipsychrobacter sp.]|nr:error-prone polymerase [Flavipsychrobacter sp.]